MLALVTALLATDSAKAQFGGLFGPKVEQISAQQLYGLLTSTASPSTANAGRDFVIVDVRSPEEIEVSIIPGAITKAEYEQNRNKYRGMTVIPYCLVGARSTTYARQLIKQGEKVLNFKGSVLAWCKAKLPLVTQDGTPTNRVHTYSARYQVPSEYDAVTR
jgi:rhodanese-related sulfurtransferase